MAGTASVAVVFVGVATAIALSPSFAFGANALSDLGNPGHSAGTPATALAFNGGLIVGGVLGTAFALALALASGGALARLGAMLFGVATVLLAAIGVFPQGHALHFPVASGFYVLFSASTLAFGVGRLHAGRRGSGAVSIGAGIGNLAVWLLWIGRGAIDRPGLAIPEIAGALFVALWVLVHARQSPPIDRRTNANRTRDR
ncbi:putative membrane protein, a putative transporter component [Halapricum desulfuricans]|uniref:Putative membrane protein, a putative transporter component n=1 Tax=Halapricum desulfuricans TaxID=2841257 RepID=A0A897MXN3_9EURY|nr:putative membrane protein, a putative transporter component [Halapricum desulfuricans]